MSVEVWWRNPELYVRDCVELNVVNLIFDQWFVARRNLDPVRFADLFIPPPLDYRVQIIDDGATREYRRGDKTPSAVYPTWDYAEDDIADLEEMCKAPPGPEACEDDSVDIEDRPVAGQEHRVVVHNIPGVNTGPGRRIAHTLVSIQDDYPDVLLHVHGLGSFRYLFGLGMTSVDLDPLGSAANDALVLPNGKSITYMQASRYTKWITLLGMKPVQLDAVHARLQYTMKSALWAAEHFRENFNFRVRGGGAIDPDALVPVPNAGGGAMTTAVTAAQPGDKMLCDTCSLAPSCKYFRDGSVCSLPSSDTSPLAKMFGSRDPDKIIDGLGTLMDVSSTRLERAVAEESELGGQNGPLDPEVTKLINSIFGNGVKLAKLLAPQRFTVGTKVAINVGGTQAAISPQQGVAEIVRHFGELGFAPENITAEMVEGLLGRANAVTVPALGPGEE